MNTPWIIGLLAAIAFFAFFEWRAFAHPLKQNTLSRCIWQVGQNWPLSIFLMGFFCGALAVHFFWNWCPSTNQGVGLLGADSCYVRLYPTGQCLVHERPI